MAAFVIKADRVIDAPVDVVWEVVSDAARYHLVADMLDRSDIVSGDGLGMVRHCVDTQGREWNEICSSWTPGETFTMRVDVATYPASFRAIFRSLEGRWIVTPQEGETRVTMRFEGDTKLGPLGRAAVAVMGRDSVLGGILDGYERLIQESLERS